MVGATVYKDRIHDRNHKPQSLCTISDEAFTLLTVENVYHRWIEIFRVNDYVTPPPNLFKTIKDKLSKDFDSKYTLSGQKSSTGKGPGKGWTEEGMQRYNELYYLVKADRIAFPKFMHDLCKKERDKVRKDECNTMNKKRKAVTLAIHEDFLVEDTQDPQDPVGEEDLELDNESDEGDGNDDNDDNEEEEEEVAEPQTEDEEDDDIVE